MTESLNGIVTLAIGNLVALLLAVTIRQQWRSSERSIPSLYVGIGVILFHVSVQGVAVVIASNFIEDSRVLLGYTAVFATLPTLWCLLLLNDWLMFRRADDLVVEVPAGDEALDMEVARRYVVWGEYDNARRAYLAYAKAHPKSAEPLFGLEGMYLGQGRFRDAANVCREIMTSFQHDVLVWTQAATRLVNLLENQLRNPVEADEVRESIARRNPSYASLTPTDPGSEPSLDEAAMSTRLEEAREAAKRGSTEAAVGILKRLRVSNPRDPRPLFELASIFEADLQTEAASRTLKTIASEFAGNPGVWSEASIKLADLYLNRYGNDGAARELLERILKQSPLPADRAAAQQKLDKLDHPWA